MRKPILVLLVFLLLFTSCSSPPPTIESEYFTTEELTGFITHDTLGYKGPDPGYGVAVELERDQQILIVGASAGGKYALIEDPSAAWNLSWVIVDSIDIKSVDILKAFEMVSIIDPDSADGIDQDLLEAFMKLNATDPDTDDGEPYFEKVPVVLDCSRNSKVLYCDPENEPSFFETFFQIFSNETGSGSEGEPGFLETFFQEFSDEPEDELIETEQRTRDDQECIPWPTATPLNVDEALEEAAENIVDSVGGILHGYCGNFICHASDTIDDFLTECGDLVYPVIYFPKVDCSEKTGCVTSTPPPVEFIPCTPVPPLPSPIILNLTLCWNGPGSGYEVISSVEQSTVVEVLGAGIDGDHVVITNPRYNRPCWVNETDIELNGLDLTGLPIFGIPEQSGSSDSPEIGCWVTTTRSGSAKCISPCPDPKVYPEVCEP